MNQPLPFSVTCYDGTAILSTHTTLTNAKRAIGVRWANLRKLHAGAVYTVAFEVMDEVGKRVYARGGYV